jgi:hypothetical protein
MQNSTGKASHSCQTCHGQGIVPGDTGPANCPDCGGDGILPSRDVLVEWRIAEIERVHGAQADEVSPHVRWLAHELRRSRHALVQVIALSEELEAADGIAQRIRFVANDALGMYEPVPDADARVRD